MGVRTGGRDYLVKPVISRLGIPRKFSTLALTSSAKPPETNQIEAVWREGACTAHAVLTSRLSGLGGEPSGPGGRWPGQPGICHPKETPPLLMKRENVCVTLKIQAVRARPGSSPRGPGSRGTLQLLPT